MLVVARRLAFGRLILFAEVAAAAFVALQRVEAHQLGEFEEVGHAAGLLERLIELLAGAEHLDVAPELLAQRGNFGERLSSGPRRCGPCRSIPT